MSGGGLLLDGSGRRIIRDDGDFLLDDGAGNDCCCGGGGGATCTDVFGPFGISDITQETTDFLTTLMPGNYRVKYTSGAMQYGHLHGDEKWYVNGAPGNGFSITDSDGFGYVDCPSPGPQDTEAEVEAAGAGLYTTFTLATSADVYLHFQDEDYAGNTGGPPLFTICKES